MRLHRATRVPPRLRPGVGCDPADAHCASLAVAFLAEAPDAAPPRQTARAGGRARRRVDPVTADWVVDEIHAAPDAHDDAVVLELETPGEQHRRCARSREPSCARRADHRLRRAERGTRRQRGLLPAQAADLAWSANAGAATPIDMGGGNVGTALTCAKLIHDSGPGALPRQRQRPQRLCRSGGGAEERHCPRCAQLDGGQAAGGRYRPDRGRPARAAREKRWPRDRAHESTSHSS